MEHTDVPMVHVDKSGIEVSRDSIRLDLATFDGVAGVVVYMPHTSAKRLAMLMRRTLKDFEREHEVIIVRDDELKHMDVAREDW